jgi:L,D-transpeptidase YcbB
VVPLFLGGIETKGRNRERSMRKSLIFIPAFIFVVFSLIFPQSESLAGTRNTLVLREHLRERITAEEQNGTFGCKGEMLCGVTQIPHFYRERGFFPAWCGISGILPQAQDLISEIKNVYEEGLRPEDYHLTQIQKTLREIEGERSAGKRVDPETFVDLDLLLTDAFMLYSSHLLAGRVNPESLHTDWIVAIPTADLLHILRSALESGRVKEVLRSLGPRDPAYHRLKSYLACYRRVEKNGPSPPLSPAASLRKGMRGEDIRRLRTRLKILGDLQTLPRDQGDLLDSATEMAVLRFQKRHSLKPDGIVGPKTLKRLNIPIKQRIQQIELNMERWRWIPHDLGERYIIVNIAGFTLQVVERGVPRLEMRVVVGKPYRRTPVFSAMMTYLVLNPYWNVPRTIAVKEMLPKVRKDSQYLARQGIRVFKDWSEEPTEIDMETIRWDLLSRDAFPYRLRQDPGPKNALGRIKFIFPNKLSVYFHDTPSRSLFKETSRIFSHGCIRVERPIDLAVYLLGDDQEWTRERIRETINTGKRKVVKLQRPLPVHLQYWTAWVDDQGLLHFQDDIYDRDGPLDQALKERLPAG